jgi:hypothetical protein
MNFNYRELLPEEFDASSRVWIYQSSRLFTIAEIREIENLLNDFTGSWNSHGVPVKGFANIFFDQFIVLMADERASMISGCSTDSSVRLIKEIENRFGIQLFDRQLLAFYVENKVQLLPLSQLSFAVNSGFIQSGTLYFNNTVLTKSEMISNWIIPVKNSWIASRVSFIQEV